MLVVTRALGAGLLRWQRGLGAVVVAELALGAVGAEHGNAFAAVRLERGVCPPPMGEATTFGLSEAFGTAQHQAPVFPPSAWRNMVVTGRD
jgi:hypothetical protein